MAQGSDGDVERGSALEQTLGGGAHAPAAGARVATVYDAIRELLADRGWVQGRESRGRRLSLTAAIDVVVVDDAAPSAGADVGPRLARTGRVRRHLGELAGAANLIAWNDDRARSVTDVMDLLQLAALAYPDD